MLRDGVEVLTEELLDALEGLFPGIRDVRRDADLDYFRQAGYLPQALLNYLSLLGWSPPNGKEIIDIDSIISQFSLKRVKASSSVFDLQKLNWVNGKHLRSLPANKLLDAITPALEEAGCDLSGIDREWLLKATESVRDNLVLTKDAARAMEVYLNPDPAPDEHTVKLFENK